MKTDDLDALLDAKLAEAAYVDDDGFTARVMKELPRQRMPLATQRSVIILLAAILSVVVAYVASGGGEFITTVYASLVMWRPAQLMMLVLAVGLTTTICALGAAFTRLRESL
jgi:anti-sigma factor RsiW